MRKYKLQQYLEQLKRDATYFKWKELSIMEKSRPVYFGMQEKDELTKKIY